jgi:hypothetical protein
VKGLFAFHLALFFLLTLPPVAAAYTGREIMEHSDQLASPKSAESHVSMLIYKGGQPDEKAFTLFAKQYPNDEDKVLISFHKPTRIQLLTHAHKEKEDDQWLVLSSGKVKRIASADKGNAFVHSHFYYEDLGSRDIDDYDYQYLGDEKAADVDCYKVESVRKAGGEKVYDKTILYARKSDFFVVRVDFYQNGRLHKFLENFDIKAIDGILTPMRVVMTMAEGNGRTELKVEKVTYNSVIQDAKFNKEALR